MSLSPERFATGAQADLEAAVAVLRQGGVVVIPTDTLYGLAVDVHHQQALEKIFHIKGRPADLALPVLVANEGQLLAVTPEVNDLARRLVKKFWPGPLTLVVPRAPSVSTLLTGQRDTVAVRMPDHPVPLYLAHNLGSPITGTSANRSGQPDLLTVEQIEVELGQTVDYITRVGPPPEGIGSTVVDVTGEIPRLLREGALPFAEVLDAC